jgi:hypothetical protein
MREVTARVEHTNESLKRIKADPASSLDDRKHVHLRNWSRQLGQSLAGRLSGLWEIEFERDAAPYWGAHFGRVCSYDLSHEQGVTSMRSKVSANPSKRPSQRSRSPASQADFLERARANVPVIIPLQHPLSWWRTRPPDQFKKTDVHIARHFLTGSAIIGEPHWFLGAAGDAAIAVGVALRTQRRKGNTLITVDLAMTAVLLTALEGNVTAALLMSAMLKRRSDIDRRCPMLSDSWLTYKSGDVRTSTTAARSLVRGRLKERGRNVPP